jgi:hypothetical protein
MGPKYHVDNMENTDRKSGRKRTLVKPRHGWKYNIAMDLK